MGQDAWTRWQPIWDAIFYVTLGVALLIALVDGPASLSWRASVIGLTLASVIWHWLLIQRCLVRRGRGFALVYCIGAGVLSLLLVRLHPVFYLSTSTLLSQVFSVLPVGSAIGISALLAFVIVTQDAWLEGRWPHPNFLVGAGSAVLFASILGLYINRIIRESQTRKELIQTLEATRRDLAQSERQAGILAERQRLAREIHDTLAQGFTSIVMHLEAAEQALPPHHPIVQQHLSQARTQARTSLAEARRVVADLRPEILDGAPLSDALARVVSQWSAAADIPATFIVTGDSPCPNVALEAALLRVTQEALANVRRHAQATEVNVTLSFMGDRVALDIQDNGIGFDPATVDTQARYGLAGMRERIAELGGQLLIESGLGEGTTLAAEVLYA